MMSMMPQMNPMMMGMNMMPNWGNMQMPMMAAPQMPKPQ